MLVILKRIDLCDLHSFTFSLMISFISSHFLDFL